MIDFLVRLLRHLAVGSVSGFIAGLIAGGIGSRLAMRVSGMMSDATLQGTLTEAQARVGEITMDGTLFLMVFSAALGIYGGLLYRILAAWIPAKTWQKGLGFGVFLLLLHGTLLIAGDNFDFERFGSVYLNLAMFILIPIAFGLIAAYSEAWLEQKLPAFRMPPLVLANLLYFPAVCGVTVLGGLIQSHYDTLTTRFSTGFASKEQAWVSVAVIVISLLVVVAEPFIKRYEYGEKIRFILPMLPALYGGFLLFQAITQILG